MAEAFDPYHKWLGIPPAQQPPNHYRLLGVDLFERDPDVIANAADQRMAHVRSFQSGQHAELTQKILNEIAAARVCLLNPAKKALYDGQLDRQLATTKPVVVAQALPVAVALPPPSPPLAPPPVAPLSPANPEAALSGIIASTPSHSVRSVLPRKDSSPVPLIAGVLGAVVVLVGGLIYLNRSGEPDSVPPVDPEKQAGQLPAPQQRPTPTAPAVETPKSSVAVVYDPKPVERPSGKAGGVARPSPSDPEDSFPDAAPQMRTKRFPAARAKDSRKRRRNTPLPSPADEFPPAPAAVAPQPLAAKTAPPDDAALEKSLQVVREVYKSDFDSAKTLQQRQALAKSLLQKADSFADDPTGRFALLTLAKDVATQAADGLTAFQAIDAMASTYQVDELELKLRVLAAGAKMARLPADHQMLAATALKLLDQAMATEALATAAQLGALAQSEAREARDPQLVRRSREKVAEEKQLTAAYAAVEAARKVLLDKPEDPEANLALGKFLCFTKGTWAAGLPSLARGSDSQLKALAEQDLAGASAANDQVALGDAWLELAAREEGKAKHRIQTRAAHWYRQALPGLTGLMKVKVEKALVEIGPLAAEEVAAPSVPQHAQPYLQPVKRVLSP